MFNCAKKKENKCCFMSNLATLKEDINNGK